MGDGTVFNDLPEMPGPLSPQTGGSGGEPQLLEMGNRRITQLPFPSSLHEKRQGMWHSNDLT